MNRQQAEHILDAYVGLECDTDGEVSRETMDALREVILDAMTDYRSSITTTYPNITLPYTHVTNPAYKPIVTCSDPKVSVTS